MSNIEIKQLVNSNRFQKSESNILVTIIYFPVGLIILALRCLLAIVFMFLGQVLPSTPPVQTFLNNLACICFGITVSVENKKKKENVEVFVSNSLSLFDHVAITKAVGNLLPLNKIPLNNISALEIADLGPLGSTDTFKRNLDKVTKEGKTPVLVCPEEIPTNGKALLKFNSQYFKFFQKVQPLCITIKRPLLDIAISTLGSTYMNDLLYFMFSPFTNYNIKFLPSLEKKSLSEDEFADIVRQNIASELKVEATHFSSSDVAEWCKRQILEEKRRTQALADARYGASRLPNPELARMATQVKEVLPHVPVSAIYGDLVHTRSVDTTITNILEGRVRFVPETAARSSTPSSATGSTSPSKGRLAAPSSSLLNLGAATFGKTATERTLSFQERKQQLIAAARQRYIEKHNLQLSPSL
ncbi:lipid droplet-regulating VLDL assembly factor AUP1-like [Euwallacea similis]|uniref:lipid droplet-regulating VLDL assembly factor AUP1-like n=1 Tax=Euwallacea similis TaxID=1736056 RepID=UPI00344BAA3D